MPTIDEKQLQTEVYNQYKNHKNVFIEVPFMSRIIDMVILEEEQITTIEFKLKNWQKAIIQLNQHAIASHYNYLCMDKNLSSTLINRIKLNLMKLGFGLFLYDSFQKSITKIIDAKKSKVVSEFAVDKLRDNIMKLNRG